jgi:3-phytase
MSLRQKSLTQSLILVSLLAIAGCATVPPPAPVAPQPEAAKPENPELVSDSAKMTHGVGTPVLAAMETKAVGSQNLDAADDPEVYVSPLGRAVILATDKKAGLYVYNIDGSVRDFNAYGALNNVDLRTVRDQLWIGATDRTNNGVALFSLDTTLKLVKGPFVPLTTSEAYGFCMGVSEIPAPVPGGNGLKVPVAVVVGKNGDVAMARLIGSPTAAFAKESLNIVRFEVGTQSEGCVIDDNTGTLYIAEENVGIWAYPISDWSKAGKSRTAVAAAPSDMLKPDVEGLTILREGGKAYLIASSQGDSAFAVWQIGKEAPVYKGRFSVMPGNGIDAVTGTDGVAALGGKVGPYPQGVVVMQDDSDTDGEALSTAEGRQNFKLVDWREVKKALAIK